jgi:signal transduction histidine kinase
MFSSIGALSQNTSLSSKVQSLKNKIYNSEAGTKLMYMDSLCWYTRDKQQYQYDSLVKTTVEYAIRLDSFNLAVRQAARLVWSLSNRLGKPEAAKKYFNEIIDKKLPVKNAALLARLYINGGDSYYFSGAIEKSITIYKTAADFALKANDSLLYGITKKYTADAYAKIGKYPESFKLLEEVENIYRKTNDTIRFLNTRSSRANLYSLNGFYKEAKIERDQVIAISKSINYYPGLLSGLFNASIDAAKTNDQEERVKYLTTGLTYANDSQELRDQYEPQFLIKLFLAYTQKKDIEASEKLLKKIQENPKRYMTGLFKEMYQEAYAYYHLYKGNYSKALALAKAYEAKQVLTKDSQKIMAAHILLYKIYEETGENQRAYDHYKSYTMIDDSISSVQKAQALLYYKTLYETEIRDAKILNQESEIIILDAQNKLKTQWMIFGGIGLLALFFIFYLYRTKQFVRGKQNLQSAYSRNLIKGQEEERIRLARDLHDSVGQKLMLLTKKTQKYEKEGVDVLAKDTLEELRSISKGLHPVTLERIGITNAIQSLVNEVDAHSGIFFTQEIDSIDDAISKDDALHLYRIIQESLNNLVKHSKSKSASVKIIRKQDVIETLIEDKGVGFDFLPTLKSNKNLGMKTLMERSKIIGSKFHIYSNLGKGTIVEVITPIKKV